MKTDPYKLYNIGLVAGNFDLIHPGYIKMFNTMKIICKQVYVCLQDDPTIERPHKNKPILTLDERISILSSLKQVDRIECNNTEDEFLELIKNINPDVRFLGDDYRGNVGYTGCDLDIPTHFIDRSHGWSTTKFKKEIFKEVWDRVKKSGEL